MKFKLYNLIFLASCTMSTLSAAAGAGSGAGAEEQQNISTPKTPIH